MNVCLCCVSAVSESVSVLFLMMWHLPGSHFLRSCRWNFPLRHKLPLLFLINIFSVILSVVVLFDSFCSLIPNNRWWCLFRRTASAQWVWSSLLVPTDETTLSEWICSLWRFSGSRPTGFVSFYPLSESVSVSSCQHRRHRVPLYFYIISESVTSLSHISLRNDLMRTLGVRITLWITFVFSNVSLVSRVCVRVCVCQREMCEISRCIKSSRLFVTL